MQISSLPGHFQSAHTGDEDATVQVCVCVRACVCGCVRGTFRLSSRLMAKASCNCSSSSPLVAGRACSKSGSKWGEEDGATWAEEEREKGVGMRWLVWKQLGKRLIQIDFERSTFFSQNRIWHFCFRPSLASPAIVCLTAGTKNNGEPVWSVRALKR